MKKEIKLGIFIITLMTALGILSIVFIVFASQKKTDIFIIPNPKVQETRSETIYLLSEKEIKRLPFCGLNWDYSTEKEINEYFCYDWHTWNGKDGIGIINLKGNYAK